MWLEMEREKTGTVYTSKKVWSDDTGDVWVYYFKYAQHAAALALTDYVCVCACVWVQKASEVKWKRYALQTCIHLSLYLEIRWGMINAIDYVDDVKWQRIFSVHENKKNIEKMWLCMLD